MAQSAWIDDSGLVDAFVATAMCVPMTYVSELLVGDQLAEYALVVAVRCDEVAAIAKRNFEHFR